MIKFSSKRLYFREWTESDAPFLHQLNANKNVIRFTGDSSFIDLEAARNFIKHYNHYETYGYGRWLCFKKEDNEPIGWAGLKNQIHTLDMIDVGFRFLEHEWGNGYATEAANKCLDIGFNRFNIDKITGRSDVSNRASINVLKKLNMTLDREDMCHGSKALIFSITSDRFKNL